MKNDRHIAREFRNWCFFAICANSERKLNKNKGVPLCPINRRTLTAVALEFTVEVQNPRESRRMSSPTYFWNYLPLLLQILVAIGMGVSMVTMSWRIGKHRQSKAKNDTYECGIDAVGDARGRFSVRFYMVAMLFILFDVEAVFMMPWAVIYRQLPAITGSKMFGFWEMLIYIGFVFVGLFYIVKKGVLEWSNDRGDL